MNQPFTNRTPTASQVMRQFVQSICDGNLRREIADECILTLIGRTVKGAGAVTHFLTGRYKHVGFVDAQACDAAQVSSLSNRYGRTFEALRRRQNARKANAPHGMRPRAGSVEPADNDPSFQAQLLTPPRLSTSEPLNYIESVGVIQPCYDPEDGGSFDQSDTLEVRLTLGYRLYPQHDLLDGAEVCMILYKKFKLTARTPSAYLKSSARMRMLRNGHTDDESELVPAPVSVRRTLFTSDDCDDPDETIGIGLLNGIPTLTPRKRHLRTDPDLNIKRPSILGMRF